MNDKRRHQQATGRTRLNGLTRFWVALAAPLIRLLARLLYTSCRIVSVQGVANLDRVLAQERAVVPCCWHQRLAVCVGYLLSARDRGLQPGFLVSPSKDGELIARVVAGLGASVIRGSATRTGARALRDLHICLRDGISPVIHPDGPHGPAGQVKSGTLMLAQMTRAPILPMAFSADRYWQLRSWDALILPKPFARICLTIGEPVTIAPRDDLAAQAAMLAITLDDLAATADAHVGAAPRVHASRVTAAK